MSEFPVVRCDPNKENNCTIDDVVCYSKDGTNYYCICHTNLYMTDDYKCKLPKVSKPVTTEVDSSFTFPSIPILYVVILILLIGVLALRLGPIIRKVRFNRGNRKNEIQPAKRPKNKIQDNPNYVKTDSSISINESVGETETTNVLTTIPDPSGINPDPGNPIKSSIYIASPGLILDRNWITDLGKIGEGHFGWVFKGCLRIPMPASLDDDEPASLEDDDYFCQEVAVKKLKNNCTSEAEVEFWTEVEMMSSFQHPNIVSLLGVCPRDNDDPPLMVFEFMQFGDLKTVLQNNSHTFGNNTNISGLPSLNLENLLSIAHQIANGMEYLAGRRYVHRDLACRNVLIGSTGSDLEAKISDFGLSKDVYINDYYKIDTRSRLPVRWMSPESIKFGKFTTESDVWSYGVVLWEMFNNGKQPYYGYMDEQVLKLIPEGKIALDIPRYCPEEVADIMISCWNIKLRERISFREICTCLLKLRGSFKNNQKIAIVHETNELSNLIISR